MNFVFQDRDDAGKQLARALVHYKNDTNTLVLALPRGGVPIGNQIAKNLNLPLDILLVRKLGVPDHEELAMGAIASGNITVLNDPIITELNISEQAINEAIQLEKKELRRRERHYRHGRRFPTIKEKKIILVDDGIATGASMHAAILALKKLKPIKIIVAIPVAPPSILLILAPHTEQLICLHKPNHFENVSQFYQDFPQTTDQAVIEIMEKYKEG